MCDLELFHSDEMHISQSTDGWLVLPSSLRQYLLLPNHIHYITFMFMCSR